MSKGIAARRGLLAVALLAALGGRVLADTGTGIDMASLRRAKALYVEGKSEYGEQRYEDAYRHFEEAYAASARPALLFNMASCLQAMERPAEAAAKLRAYLMRVPDEPERPALEERIRELSDVGHGVARARSSAAPSNAAPARGASALSQAALEERIRVLEEKLAHEAQPAPSRRALAIGFGVGAGVLVVAGVALTLGLVLSSAPEYTASTIGTGPLQATQ